MMKYLILKSNFAARMLMQSLSFNPSLLQFLYIYIPYFTDHVASESFLKHVKSKFTFHDVYLLPNLFLTIPPYHNV